jgi:hypothetical protein
MCGGIFVDENFEAVMRSALGKRWGKLKPEQIKKVMNDEWEYGIKRAFNNQDKDWEVRLPTEATGSTLSNNIKPSRFFRRSKEIDLETGKQGWKVMKSGIKLSR